MIFVLLFAIFGLAVLGAALLIRDERLCRYEDSNQDSDPDFHSEERRKLEETHGP